MSLEGVDISRTLEFHEKKAIVFSGDQEEHYPEKMENLKEKVLSLEKSLYLAEQVILAKNELIEQSKIEK
ncbi:MAG: hypothetical protein HQ565_00635 [Bacteroidetes bacterium]|nr:hypothetical protein [Bacteroidota bacterium]